MVGARGDAQKIHVAVTAHHHHVLDQNGKIPIDFLALRNVGDDVALQRRLDAWPSTVIDPPEAGTKPMMALNKGRLSAAVNSIERRNRAVGYLEAGVLQGGVARCGR
jgi:hypothetical protein